MPDLTRLSPAELQAHRYLELDSLRGLAAATVVMSHFLGVWQFDSWHRSLEVSPLRILFAGHEAVILFFVLSGFVLSVQCSGKRALTYPGYLLKRFCRIYLPFAATVLVSALCCLALYSRAPSGNAWADTSWTIRPSVQQVFMLLLASMHRPEQLNVAIWSILLEIRVSILFPLLLWLSRHIYSAFLLGGFVLMTSLFQGTHGLMGAIFTLILVSGLFILGILLHKHMGRVSDWYRNRTAIQGVLFFGGSLLCFESMYPLLERFAISHLTILNVVADYFVGIGAVGILICAMHDQKLRTILRHPVLLRLGALSYSTYLVHGIVLFVLIRLFFGRIHFYYLLPAYLVGVYLVSEAFHALIDKPSVLLGRRLTQ
jgi:peptidoglycan/LPS O-acetylase OafA/YrhL